MPLGNTFTETLQSNAVANGNGTVIFPEGYDKLTLTVMNGAGTCQLTFESSSDPTFATPQDVLPQGVVLQTSNVGGVGSVNTSQAILPNPLAIAANSTYQYQLYANVSCLRARISNAAGLAAGTSHTGCTVLSLRIP